MARRWAAADRSAVVRRWYSAIMPRMVAFSRSPELGERELALLARDRRGRRRVGDRAERRDRFGDLALVAQRDADVDLHVGHQLGQPGCHA
jgi:hypothetical protein